MRGALLALATVALVACSSASPAGSAPPSGHSRDGISGTVNIFAAASLTAVFREEAKAFQALHPAAEPVLNFGGSAALATSINNGAPADVFASADAPNMQKVVGAGNTSNRPVGFASNRLQIVVPAGNPKGIRSLSDLAGAAVVVVLCAPAVPCGNYASQALAKAAVKVTPRSLEQDVNAVLTKVATGEADAGIVYVTDVRAAGARVQGVEIPEDVNVVASYPVATLKGGGNAKGGEAFLEFLLSPAGQALLAGHGFGRP